MRATVTGSYKKINKAGNLQTVFRCEVSGSDADMAAFKADQGENYRTDEKTGKVLFFTTRPIGKSFNLIRTAKGQWIPDSSELDLQAAIVSQAGGNLGQEIAKIAAGQFMFSTPAPVASAPVVEAPADNLNQA